ncbi:SI1L3 protein, partial [Alcedo cyanopectus]|nr:SI1L3 protein [Ceyx cyanopectus]
MGVRARIAEWPPKRDPKEAAGHREAAAACGRAPGFPALPASSRRRSKEAEFQEGWPRACPAKAWSPLRHRSSSEVTLSECEPDEQAEKPGSPAGLYREYGSTSSIDVQGISEQSFFQMLTELRGKRSERGAGDAVRDKPRRKGPRWEGGSESIFRKLRSGPPAERSREEPGRGWVCQRSFAHYDVQSMLFDLHGAARNPAPAARRRNTATGASAASADADPSSLLPPEDLNRKENLEHDGGDATSNELLLSCPHFRNEIGGGGGERHLSFAGAAAAPPPPEPPDPPRLSNAGVNVLEGAADHQRMRQLSVEHLDLGARYYREHFHGK